MNHVDLSEAEALHALLQFRARTIREPTVLFPSVVDLIDRIENLLKRGVVGTRAECFPVVGQSGVGKSHALRYLESKYQRKHVHRVSQVKPGNSGLMLDNEILYVETPSPATRKALIDEMLSALEPDAIPSKMKTIAAKRDRLLEIVRRANVRLIIVDEFQHLIDSKSQRIVME